jgi:tRNA-specific 2-thiouridylase
VHRFTVGQRRGLGLSAQAPLYVREIRTESGEIVVGPRESLAAAGLVARDISFVDPDSIGAGAIAVEARIRYRHPALPATLAIESGSRARVIFANGGGPAVTPGQACVFYRGDEVVGGGFIERALSVSL